MKKVLLIFGVVGFALIACSGPSDQSMNAKIRDVGVVFLNRELNVPESEKRTLFAEAIVSFTNDYTIQPGDVVQIAISQFKEPFEQERIRLIERDNSAIIGFSLRDETEGMPLGEWRFTVDFSDGSSQEMSATTTGPNGDNGDNDATTLYAEGSNNSPSGVKVLKRPAVTEAKHGNDTITVKYTSTDNRANRAWVALYEAVENNRLAFLGTTPSVEINTTTNATSNGMGNSRTITVSSDNTSADITRVTDVIVCIADYVSPPRQGTAHHACSKAKKVSGSNGN